MRAATPSTTGAAAFANLDTTRLARVGLAEAVYGPGKSAAQCAAIVAEFLAHAQGPVILTRATAEQIDAAAAVAGEPVRHGMTAVWRAKPPERGHVVVVTAGTGDLPVAGEAAAVLGAYGVTAEIIPDVGVAGLHRILAVRERFDGASAVIVIAGMEGALASVVGGLVAAPIIAVPTSTGYGAGLEGVTALLAMLASCAQGITVVGIDNGFGAACAALRILGAGERVAPEHIGDAAGR
jgi:hypothetical protein